VDAAGGRLRRAIIDLLQPELLKRIGLRQIRRAAATRHSMTTRLLAALQSIPSSERPLLLSVSGVDDLTLDDRRNVDDDSPLRAQLSGFAYIGVPVRRLIEDSGVACAYVYLGTVYGPGKSFASKIFPQLATAKLRLPGKGASRMAVVHVEDAARALLHIAQLGADRAASCPLWWPTGIRRPWPSSWDLLRRCVGGPRPKTFPATRFLRL
jgi:hypothetical protein